VNLSRRAPLQHPLAGLFAGAVESLGAALAPGSVRQYRGTARNFLIYLGAAHQQSLTRWDFATAIRRSLGAVKLPPASVVQFRSRAYGNSCNYGEINPIVRNHVSTSSGHLVIGY
jgi:hypothetical protein